MSTLKTNNIKTLDDTLNIPLTSIALKSELNATSIEVTPTGGISQTNVQAALASIDTRILGRQPLDGTLTALASVSTAANTLIYATASDTFTTTPLTSFGRSLLDDADASAARTTLGVTSLISGTAVATTSGTSVDFTGIPSNVRRITLSYFGVTTNGTAPISVQIGGAAIETSGYLGSVSSGNSGVNTTAFGSGFFLCSSFQSGSSIYGQIVLTLLNNSDAWVGALTSGQTGSANYSAGGGAKTLSSSLTRLRVTTSTGTNLFTGGAVNIMYEV